MRYKVSSKAMHGCWGEYDGMMYKIVDTQHRDAVLATSDNEEDAKLIVRALNELSRSSKDRTSAS